MTQSAALQEAVVRQQCKALRMPAISSQFSRLSDEAIKARQSHIGYLEALLAAEIEERERNTVERRFEQHTCQGLKLSTNLISPSHPKSRLRRCKTWRKAATSNERSRSFLLGIPILGHSAPPCYIIENMGRSNRRFRVDGLIVRFLLIESSFRV